jgi:REP element-mobilizing transposase RayT
MRKNGKERVFMPRQARQISKTGVYHVLVRGINRADLFHDDEDRRRYLETLARIAGDASTKVLGYCLMDNHVHLLLAEDLISISNVMHRLGASYAYYYNRRYERTGHVFQNRFKSENVEDESYLQAVIRYIHQNPVKAGLARSADEYRWSSCRVYYGKQDYCPDLTSTTLILGLFSKQKERAIKALRNFTEEETSDMCLEDLAGTALSDTQARQVIEKVMQMRPVSALLRMTNAERDEVLHQLKRIEGLSIRQISRLTGVSFNIVKRAK